MNCLFYITQGVTLALPTHAVNTLARLAIHMPSYELVRNSWVFTASP